MRAPRTLAARRGGIVPLVKAGLVDRSLLMASPDVAACFIEDDVVVPAGLNEMSSGPVDESAARQMTGRETLRRLSGFARYPSQIHGPAHWARVQRFGALLAETEDLPPAARTCVEVFAQIHDLAREDDGGGNQHAIDGAFYMDEVVSAVFDGQLSKDQIETVRTAIRYHSDGTVAQQ